MRSLLQIIGGGLLGLWAIEGHGATLTLDSRSIPGLAAKSSIVNHTIRLSGPIEAGDADKLRAIFSRLRTTVPAAPDKPLATVEFASSGGDTYEGLKIGYLLRQFNVASLVRAKDVCLSACALAFMGGTQSSLGPDFIPSRSIELGGQVGFHNFSLNTDSAQLGPMRDARDGLNRGFSVARGGAAALVAYGAVMGISTTFLARLLGQPPDQWEYVDTANQFAELDVCPLGVNRPPISPPAIATNICNHATGWFSPATPAQARPLAPREAKRHLLEQVQRNVEALSLKGPLAGQLMAVLASRDQNLIDSVYADLRSAGISLPDLPGPTFEVDGYATGGYTLRCYVSFSSDSPDKFDVVLQGPAGLTKPFQTPPAHCPWLFRYDRDDMLNPRR